MNFDIEAVADVSKVAAYMTKQRHIFIKAIDCVVILYPADDVADIIGDDSWKPDGDDVVKKFYHGSGDKLTITF